MWLPALALSASSQVSAAASPYLRATEVTMGWKSVSAPGRAILPFHLGWARSMTDAGSWLGLMSQVWYTMRLTRAEMPAHFPAGELYLAGICARVDGWIGESSPF